MRTGWTVPALTLAILLSGTQQADAQFFKMLNNGLFWTGFRVDAARNPITKGYDARADRYFINETADLGFATVTLRGQLTLTASLTKLPTRAFSYGISTEDNPLSYTITLKDAVQDVTVTGDIIIDYEFSMNGGGWYHKTLKVRNRGTIEADGVLAEADNNIDFDLGPIDMSGNVFIDAAAFLVDLAGGDSSSLRGVSSAGPFLVLGEQEVALDAEILAADQDLAEQINAAVTQAVLEAATAPTRAAMVVPEPSAIALLVLGCAYLTLKRHRRAG